MGAKSGARRETRDPFRVKREMGGCGGQVVVYPIELQEPNYAPINIGASMGKQNFLEALLALPKLKC